MILAAVAVWAVATGLFAYIAFKAGYSLGWEERCRDMTLPRKYLAETTGRLDDDETFHRHSAIDPKKPMWHG